MSYISTKGAAATSSSFARLQARPPAISSPAPTKGCPEGERRRPACTAHASLVRHAAGVTAACQEATTSQASRLTQTAATPRRTAETAQAEAPPTDVGRKTRPTCPKPSQTSPPTRPGPATKGICPTSAAAIKQAAVTPPALAISTRFTEPPSTATAPRVSQSLPEEAPPIGFGKTVPETSAYAAYAVHAGAEARQRGLTATTEAALRGS